MVKGESVLQIKNYGTVQLKLKELLDSRGITRNALARKINSRFEVVNKWYRDQLEEVDLDVLARICFVLDCKVEDILEYKI